MFSGGAAVKSKRMTGRDPQVHPPMLWRCGDQGQPKPDAVPLSEMGSNRVRPRSHTPVVLESNRGRNTIGNEHKGGSKWCRTQWGSGVGRTTTAKSFQPRQGDRGAKAAKDSSAITRRHGFDPKSTRSAPCCKKASDMAICSII